MVNASVEHTGCLLVSLNDCSIAHSFKFAFTEKKNKLLNAVNDLDGGQESEDWNIRTKSCSKKVPIS